ncbi:MAG: TIGR03013 family PEP-CTERM/XrtA system glycosyltransferase [Planctomycetes bacterium]|nr:TIGR03013 family PEP-CTERM/XrtA system glycosyltransferase [Planctomycetota bacterium]
MFQVFRRGVSYQVLILLGTDVGIMVASLGLGLAGLALAGANVSGMLSLRLLFPLAIYLVGAFLFDLHHPHVSSEGRPLFMAILKCAGLTAVVLCATRFVAPALLGFSWKQIAVLVVCPFLGLSVWRFLWKDSLANESFLERVLILGTGDKAKDVAREILARHVPGFRVVGFVGSDPADVGVSILNPTVVGTYDELSDVIRREAVGCVVVAEDDRRKLVPMETLLEHKLHGGHVFEDTSFLELTAGKVPLRGVLPSWFVFSDGFHKSPFLLAAKRIVETAFALLFLAAASPVIVVVAILIKLDSKGPIFFRQERVGRGGRIFKVVKLRSMFADAEQRTGPVWASEGDPRVTRVGKWIRRFRIDEIPQMWNIIRGEMALVGPRPERPHFVEILKSEVPYYAKRHAVRPGLTGWAQVNYPYGSTIEDARRKLEYDFYYIKHVSLFLDLFILAKTFKTILVEQNGH